MSFWQFLDKQFDRMKVEHVAGGGVFILTILIFGMIAARPELAQDDLFKTLAQAVIVQGLVGLAMAAWFTKRSADKVEVTNSPDNPVPVDTPEGGA